jgi:hypothetical protein
VTIATSPAAVRLRQFGLVPRYPWLRAAGPAIRLIAAFNAAVAVTPMTIACVCPARSADETTDESLQPGLALVVVFLMIGISRDDQGVVGPGRARIEGLSFE